MITDSETGEYVNSNVYRLTGEQPLDYDLETGEPESTTQCPPTIRPRKTRFNVPRVFLAHPEAPKRKKCVIEPDETYSLTDKDEVITLHEDIIQGYIHTSHRLCVIIMTAMYLLSRQVVFVGILTEFAMHGWAHHKNRNNTDPNVYHRSPLHVFTAMFCASCRREKAMNQVIKMQDQRHRSWQLKDVARTIY